MIAKTLMSVEEYLHTSFEEGDCDFIKGEIEGRHLGDGLPSDVQTELIGRLLAPRAEYGIIVLGEIRVQIDSVGFRVADVAVWRAGLREPGTRCPGDAGAEHPDCAQRDSAARRLAESLIQIGDDVVGRFDAH